MYRWLFIAALVALSVASPEKSKTAEDEGEHLEQESRRIDYSQKPSHDEHEHKGPVVLRTIRPHDGHVPDIAKQNKIIADVYNPDYYQPTWILDYRYLKTGGRDYTRGPGGQYIILPKNVHSKEHKEFQNYDEFLEHLRHKSMVEREQMRNEREKDSHKYYGHHDQDHHPDHENHDKHGHQDQHEHHHSSHKEHRGYSHRGY